MMKVLIVLVVILGVIAIAQLTRVYELTAELRKKREEEVSDNDNNMNGILMLVFMVLFYAFFFWQLYEYGGEVLNDHAATKHGVQVDQLFNFNFVILFIVFFFTQTLLFFFAYKYRGKEGMKALFYPHNNKLEAIWTVIPAIFLAVIIIYGLKTWNQITDRASEDAITVEVYGKQFDWTIRYPGPDGKLGRTNFNLITPSNPLGIITEETIDAKLKEIEEKRREIRTTLEEKRERLPIEDVEEKEDQLHHLKLQKGRIEELTKGEVTFDRGYDDKIVKTGLHLPVDQEVAMVIRSRDVIHSVYIPQLRVQMNAVPGMKTHFNFTPTITTDSMATIENNEDFSYTLLCNKICGAAHYNMKMDVFIDEQEKFDKWLNDQKTFAADLGVEEKLDDKQLADKGGK